MLVLSRREGEAIVIDEEITITVLELHSNFVRLGLDAPNNVKILRDELVGKDQVDELLLVTMQQEREDHGGDQVEEATGAIRTDRGGVADRSERMQEGRERMGPVPGVPDEPSDTAATG